MKQVTPTKVPAIWFDFYVRFLPGVAFVFLNGERLGFPNPSHSGLSLMIACFSGYLIGHVLQPLASATARKFELIYISEDELLRNDLAISDDRREKELQSKQYSEIASFAMFSILATIHLVITIALLLKSSFPPLFPSSDQLTPSNILNVVMSIISIIFFISMCHLRAKHSGARKKRTAYLLEKVKSEKESKKARRSVERKQE